MTDQRTDHAPWPMRAALLFGLGALSGLVFDLLIRGDAGTSWSLTDSTPRLSLATFVASSGALFAFTLERVRWAWSLAFAACAGAVLGLIFYWSISPDHPSAYDFWRAFAALLAVAIAAPLFQTMRDEGGGRLPYVPVHAHAWSNVVLWCAAWAFVLIAWLLIQLLAELFQLIGITLLRDLMDKSWANWMLVGGTLGAAVGLLRDRDRVVGLLQRVVTTILAVLAPVLAIGLVLFELALPFTGLDRLWEQTRATTPILLACVFGAFILANAVIGTGPEEEAKNPVLRWSAMALGAAMLPLVAVASISTGLRIGQYGFTPERLWAIVFVAIAAACALLYLYALLRGRTAWADRIRPANIRLAIGVCAIALLLATPLADFGAISTRSQLARLDSGEITPERLDWRALRFDFGPSGIAALERLKATSSRPETRALALSALSAHNRWDIDDVPEAGARPAAIIVEPRGTPIPPALLAAIRGASRPGRSGCGRSGDCLLFFRPQQHAVIVLTDNCALLRRHAYAETSTRTGCTFEPAVFIEEGGQWRLGSDAITTRPAGTVPMTMTPQQERESLQREGDAILRGEVEVRAVQRRQLFIAGRPVDQPFE
jgi:hypothetical protein